MTDAALIRIRAALRCLLPVDVASSIGRIAAAYPPLVQAELAATGRMSSIRLQEFSAGRAHARNALQELGLSSAVIPIGPDRSPQWPEDFVGSISHAGELALAVAAPRTVLRSIGIDLEPARPLEAGLLTRVCRPEELAQMHGSPAPLERAKLIFSAKESVYKCIAPLMGIFLEFDALEILFDADEGGFRVRGHEPVESLIGPETVAGKYVQAGGYWVTAAWQRPE